MTEEKKKAKKPKAGYRHMTMAQKAEAAALWRAGSVTLAELSMKYKKSPETISSMFKRMGVEKGSDAAAAAAKIVAMTEARALTDTEQVLIKIAETKTEHYKMAGGLAKLAWAELVRARQAGIDIASLKELMATLKLAGDVIGNARKELFAVLNVEKHDSVQDFDELPELTVRELTGVEILQLQAQPTDEISLEGDSGGEMMVEDLPEGL